MPISRTSMHVRLSSVPDVDATDARLLLALNDDPRASVMALSQRLGLARNTVQARLSRLESSGVLASFERRVRPEALGYRLRAYVTVQVVQRSLAEVADALAHIPEVLEGIGLSGVVDLLVEVAATDADDLWRITEQVLAIPGVQRTDTALALRRFVDHRIAPLLERTAGLGGERATLRAVSSGSSAPAAGVDAAGHGGLGVVRRAGEHERAQVQVVVGQEQRLARVVAVEAHPRAVVP